MRRRRLLPGLGAVALLVAGIEELLVMLESAGPISEEGAARNTGGMTEEDVNAVLGKPERVFPLLIAGMGVAETALLARRSRLDEEPPTSLAIGC